MGREAGRRVPAAVYGLGVSGAVGFGWTGTGQYTPAQAAAQRIARPLQAPEHSRVALPPNKVALSVQFLDRLPVRLPLPLTQPRLSRACALLRSLLRASAPAHTQAYHAPVATSILPAPTARTRAAPYRLLSVRSPSLDRSYRALCNSSPGIPYSAARLRHALAAPTADCFCNLHISLPALVARRPPARDWRRVVHHRTGW